MRPSPLVGSAPSHNADVTARNAVYLCVGTAQLGQDRLRLAGWCEVVALGNYVKQICPQPLQIDDLSSDLQFPFHESIVAVKIYDELSIGAARHGKNIRDPGIHGVPCFHDPRIVEVVPKLAVLLNVV